MGSFTGTSTAAPQTIVDDAPDGCFTVVTAPDPHLWQHALGVDDAAGIPAPAYGEALAAISGVLGVSSLGIYRVSGVPAVALAAMPQGPPYRLRGSLKTAPTGAAFIYAVLCADAALASGYVLKISATAWVLAEITAATVTPLDTFSTPPVSGDEFEFTINALGDLAVDIEGTEQLSGTNDDHLALRYWGFAFTGDGAIGLYNDGFLTVDNA